MKLSTPSVPVSEAIQQFDAVIASQVMPNLIKNLKQTNPLLGDFAARMDTTDQKHVHTFLKNACAALPMAGILEAYESVIANEHEPEHKAGFTELSITIESLSKAPANNDTSHDSQQVNDNGFQPKR